MISHRGPASWALRHAAMRQGFAPGEVPMRRAVAFAKDIAASKKVSDLFPRVVETYREMLTDSVDDGHDVNTTNLDLAVQVHHVDGTYNALERNRELQWLKAPLPENECRILSNARCLSEGVDVPALDAVMFLHPRNSVVDVVQSVGRVMRKSEGKDYGYIILPVAVPAGVSPSQALSDNRRFKVVWQVLNALRAHDDRFNAMVNSIALNTSAELQATGQGSDQLLGGHIGPTTENPESIGNGESTGSAGGDDTGSDSAVGVADGDGSDVGRLASQMALFSLSEWQEAIYTRIVDRVGTRTYWEDWAKDVADIAAALIARIKVLIDGADPTVTKAFARFHKGLQDNLNDSITRDDAISMLAQHLITAPVFDALFAGHEFAAHNPVSRTMQAMVDQLGGAGLEAETEHLEGFYDSVRVRASEVTTADGKQQVIAELYEKFFKVGFAKQADALGIVYTPVEIVDFILRAADHASREAFGRGLTDDAVHILDPFTGTGTFITRLMQSGLVCPDDLARKYASELHANEIMLLAYYIAAVNIETTYHALTKTEYSPFEGIVLTDTFQMTEDDDSMDTEMFPQNNSRIVKQLVAPIHIIVGNPPYSVGQATANDSNANMSYPTLDKWIANTYAKRSAATNKNSLYDSYFRAFRWATNRIGDHGIVAFVSNGGWIDSKTATGVRLSFADEFSRIFVYNLRGNQVGDWRREGGKVFGEGSQTGIAILIGIKNPEQTGPCEIFYRDIGDYLSREDKLAAVRSGTVDSIEWRTIHPDVYGDWINQRGKDFPTWPALGDKKGGLRIFSTHAYPLLTARDAWVYNFSLRTLRENVPTTIQSYNEQAAIAAAAKASGNDPADAISYDAKRISWSSSLVAKAEAGAELKYRPDAFVDATYRPFMTQRLYFDRDLNHRVGLLPRMFPTPAHGNLGFCVVGTGSAKPFSVLMVRHLPDLSFWGSGSSQYFPRWTYEKSDADDGALTLDTGDSGERDEYGYHRVDNITDEAMKLYRDAVNSQATKDDIFFYVYGLLHDPVYRASYAADLKKLLPHIPTPETRARFEQLVSAGRALSDLHVGYEDVEPFPVDVRLKPGTDPADRETWRVSKLKWAKKKDMETGKSVNDVTKLIYNPKVTITGIPEAAERYMLGSRSALAWIIDRYQVKVDKASGILNDPNDWCDEHDHPRYIVDLIAKVTTVSVETMRIVDSLGAAAE
ncbi:DEAD/DEAH box helicase [Gordonia sp. zg691]|nr:DEAD/DEAH box helicase [Gordonia jinghuaiqii]